MTLISLLVCFLSIFAFCSGKAIDKTYPYQVLFIDQFVDHFNEEIYKDKTYQQKYLYSDKHWKAGSGPIFFYPGNEGPIEDLWKSFGFIHELAAEMEGMIVFAEHRYFGSSMPFGKDSLTPPYIGLLSFEQAIADYAVLLTEILKIKNCSDCKIISLGGSYGGMLSAYMRLKYPDLVTGALAASAPVYMEDRASRRGIFFSLVTKDYRDADPLCADLVSRVFAVTEMLAESESGLKTLSDAFKLCEPMKTKKDYQNFLGWNRKAFVVLAMMDYPYPAYVMENLPAYPVNVGCRALTTAHNPVYGLRDLVSIYYNNSKTVECYNVSAHYRLCADPTGCDAGPDALAWDYLACTELWMPDSSNGVTDMFPDMPWDDHMRSDYCFKTFGVRPRHQWTTVQFWGENLKAASNIIFSNGNLDPWRGCGVLEDISDTVVAIEVKGGAHHIDLMAPNPADTAGITEARQKEREIIRKWINN